MSKHPNTHLNGVSIVGAGISGLYCGLELLDAGVKQVTIFEKYKTPGGRIFTDHVEDGNVHFEAGAGRFNKNHVLLWKLLDKYKLVSDVVPLSRGKQYIKDGKVTSFNCDSYLQKALLLSAEYDEHYLRSIPFRVYLSLIYPNATLVDDIIYAFGYNTEMEYMNAWETLRLIKSDFMEDVDYYGLRGGLSRLIQCMVSEFLDKGGKICYGVSVGRYAYTITSGATLYDDQDRTLVASQHCVVFCVPKNALSQITGVITCSKNKKLQQTIHALGVQPLLRVYARFSDGKWFEDVRRSTTNDMLRYIIPINPVQGIIMISYTDGMYADLLGKMSTERRNETIMTHVRHVFPNKNIPNPQWMKSYYWEEGGHFWHPSKSRTKHNPVYKNTKSTLRKYGYAICGELLSETNHAWIEGALQSVHLPVQIIKNLRA